MTDLDPCLQGCDSALAEADRLMQLLCGFTASLDPEVATLRLRIAALRKEVERLRGMPGPSVGSKKSPNWIDYGSDRSPWAAPNGVALGQD